MNTMSEAIEAYDEMLNGTHQWPTIAGIQFAPADILRIDRIAYNEGFYDTLEREGIDVDDLIDDAELP